ncbi:unnamed protein product [Discosporangium mesarthrocarpum]
MEVFSHDTSGSAQRPIGRVREDFKGYWGKCYECCCRCTHYTDVETGSSATGFEKVYSVRVNLCCCGPVNNCCAPTCCIPDAIYDVLDTQGSVVAQIQNTFAPQRSCVGTFRCCFDVNTYLLSFPERAGVEERMLLMASLLSIDYQLFEDEGQGGNGNSG